MEVALEEERWFIKTFSSKEFPKDAPLIAVSETKIEILKLIKKCLPEKSNSELRKLIEQGAVRFNGEKIIKVDNIIELKNDEVNFLRVGKRNFFKVRF